MNNKELKKLSRRELVDLIYLMKKNEQQMQEELDALQQAAQDKRIRLSNAGSIAEAAAGMTQIFSAAQTTADLYLQEIACMKEDAEKECAKMIEDAQNKVNDILREGQQQYENLGACYQAEYQKLLQLRGEIQTLEASGKDESCEG